MFGKRDVKPDPRRFWTWFAAEAQGLTNALEALSRGEADAEWALDRLNAHIGRFDKTLKADVARTLDGKCHMAISGADQPVMALLASAPALSGWRISAASEATDPRRVPFRLAPRPSLDHLTQPLTGHYEAYA